MDPLSFVDLSYELTSSFSKVAAVAYGATAGNADRHLIVWVRDDFDAADEPKVAQAIRDMAPALQYEILRRG